MRTGCKKEVFSPITPPPQEWNEYFEKMFTEDRPQFKNTPNSNPKIAIQGSPRRLTAAEVKEICKNGEDSQSSRTRKYSWRTCKIQSSKAISGTEN